MDAGAVIGLLETLAEIAAAFAGFAALVSIFRGADHQQRLRVFAIANVVIISIAAIGAAMLAAVLLAHQPAPFTWRLCSALFAAGWVVGIALGWWGYASLTGSGSRADGARVIAASVGLSAVGIALLVWNVVAPEPPAASLRYCLALLCQLAVAANMFVVAVFGTRGSEAGAS